MYRTNNINVNVPRHRCIRSNAAELINIIAAFKEGMTQFFNFMKKFFFKEIPLYISSNKKRSPASVYVKMFGNRTISSVFCPNRI